MTSNPNQHIKIGAIIFPNMDQCDFTGPFEVLSRLPDSTFHVVWKRKEPIRDYHGLILTPETDLAGCPKLDLLVVPGGHGQEALMDDEEVLAFVRTQSRYRQIRVLRLYRRSHLWRCRVAPRREGDNALVGISLASVLSGRPRRRRASW